MEHLCSCTRRLILFMLVRGFIQGLTSTFSGGCPNHEVTKVAFALYIDIWKWTTCHWIQVIQRPIRLDLTSRQPLMLSPACITVIHLEIYSNLITLCHSNSEITRVPSHLISMKTQLFIQKFIPAYNKEIIEVLFTGSLESMGGQWIPCHKRPSNAKSISTSWCHHYIDRSYWAMWNWP